MPAQKTLVVLQPSYIPWLGYFNQIYQSDIFVFLDDVQYTKQDWRNRNLIINSGNQTQYLTVPVHFKHHLILIQDILINYHSQWQNKHLRTLHYQYRNAPYFQEVFAIFESELLKNYSHLADLNISLIRSFCDYIQKPSCAFYRSSNFKLKHSDPTKRLVSLCQQLDITDYLSGNSAKKYLHEDLFQKNNISLHYHNYQHPIYPQKKQGFCSHLSIIDLLFFHGQKSHQILINDKEKARIGFI